MDCTQCKMQLTMHARFCPTCGTATPSSAYPPSLLSPTQPLSSEPAIEDRQPPVPSTIHAKPEKSPARSGRRAGCVLASLTTFILLLILASAGWVFVARPYIHELVQNRLSQAMAETVEQIPPQAAVLLPAGKRLIIQENTITDLVAANLTPRNSLQNLTTHVSTSAVRLEFQLFGMPNAISVVPTVQNGQLVTRNVTVEGIVALILSSEELTDLLDKHLRDAQTRINHSVQSVQLKDQQMEVVLGP